MSFLVGRRGNVLITVGFVAGILAGGAMVPVYADDPAKAGDSKLVKLSPDHEVWIDKEHKRVVLGGSVCLRQGQLEMFACLAKSKEHESVVAVNTKAYLAHAGLIAVGAEPGHPAQFRPKYQPATGTEIDITVYYSDEQGKRHKLRAQEWLKNVKTGKEMTESWVFGGSGYWVDRDTGQRFYQAEDGDFICVSNFTTATLDLPVESPQANASLLFEANTDKIPPRGTRVSIVLMPRLKDVPRDRGDDPKVDLLPQAKPTEEAK